jgi:ribose transport system substrate-binding protein
MVKNKFFIISSLVLGCLIATTMLVTLPAYSSKSDGDEMGAEEEKLEFVLVPKSAHPWYDPGRDGFAAAAEELGFDFTYQAPAEYGGEAQANLLENLVAQGVDGIAIAVVDASVLKPAINAAMDYGIPVIAWNAGSGGSKQIMEIATDNFEAGALHGKTFVEMLDGKPANFVITTPDLTSENLKQRVEGIRSVTKDHQELVELTSEQPVFQQIDTAVEVAQNLLTAYPEMDAYLDVAMVGAQGMVVVMKERGMSPDDLMQICWTNMPEIVAAVDEGYITGTLRQNPYAQGYLAAYGLKYYIDGKRPTQEKFSTGIVLLDKGNMLEIEEINIKRAHGELKQEFDKIWK